MGDGIEIIKNIHSVLSGMILGSSMEVELDSQIKIITTAKCLAGFRPQDLKQILSISSRQSWRKGVNIFLEGDAGRDMFILCSGKVLIWRGIDTDRVELATLGPGDSLGEMGLVSNGSRRAGAQAIEDSMALRINYEGLLKAPMAALLLFRNIAWGLAERLHSANDTIFHSRLNVDIQAEAASDKDACAK
jgi:CRP-like cAMP-binding protein